MRLNQAHLACVTWFAVHVSLYREMREARLYALALPPQCCFTGGWLKRDVPSYLFYSLNAFIILSVLNISMSYSLLNICLFLSWTNLMQRPESLCLEFSSLFLIPKIEIGLEVWFLQDMEANYRPSSLDLRQTLALCWREMQDMTSLDAE
jgi:hypothetical protein